MIKLVVEFFSKNWQGIIAVLGFGISLFNLLYLLKNNRKKIKIRELFYLKLKMTQKYFYEFNLIVTNESRLPISIIDAKILNNGKVYSAKMDRQIIKQHKSKSHPDITFYSSEFPINLSGLDSSKEMIVFSLDEKIEKEEFTIIFTTSRGVVKKKVNFVEKEITPNEYMEKTF